MRRYWRFVIPAAAVVVLLVVLLFNLNSNLVYFNTPTELVEREVDVASRLRLGGQVVPGSVAARTDGVDFLVTDGRFEVPVVHEGAPQQLFQEGVGVVLEGTWDGTAFHSDTMLVKHDEQYRTEEGDEYIEGEGVAEP